MKRYISAGGEEWHFIYGADDERFWSHAAVGSGSMMTLRDLSGRVLRQFNLHLGWTHEDYVYRDGLLLAGFLSDGQQRHFDVDHLGTPRLITDRFGNQVSFHRYYPFGKEQTALQEGERMKFTGHERDLANVLGDGDDLDYMHARHYSPLLGRFLSTDRAGGYPSAPQSWNRYTYVRNSPPNLVDPDGYEPIPPEQLRFLTAYFGHDFSNVSLHTGWYGALIAWMYGGQWGVTVGNQIYLSPSAVRAVRSSSPEGMAGLGHELTHVLSYEVLGARFFWLYGLDIVHNITRGTPFRELHYSLMLERAANIVERDILSTLTSSYKETVTTCGGAGSEFIECFATVEWHKSPPLLPPLSLFSGFGLSPQGYSYSLIGSPYDLFLSGAACLEGICL